jgi:hypothetical protein
MRKISLAAIAVVITVAAGRFTANVSGAQAQIPAAPAPVTSLATSSGLQADVIRLAGTCVIAITRAHAEAGDTIVVVPCDQ